jgi:hypothetical protein
MGFTQDDVAKVVEAARRLASAKGVYTEPLRGPSRLDLIAAVFQHGCKGMRASRAIWRGLRTRARGDDRGLRPSSTKG